MMYNSVAIQSNIEEIWEQHNMSDYISGKGWYESANSFALELAQTYNADPMQAAAVISALSPQKEWNHNMQLAQDFFTYGWRKVRHTQLQKKKAMHVGEFCETREDINRMLGGLKTINFFNNIYDPKDRNWCTIDRHMIKVGLGKDKQALTKKQYEFLKKEYCIFANRVNLIPCEFQAILWVTIKRVKK